MQSNCKYKQIPDYFLFHLEYKLLHMLRMFFCGKLQRTVWPSNGAVYLLSVRMGKHSKEKDIWTGFFCFF